MADKPRFVFDTNVLISALLLPNSTPRIAVRRAIENGTLLQSEATLREIADVLRRDKLSRYVTPIEREAFLRRLIEDCEIATPREAISACRDPSDNKFLELSVEGEAITLVSGDQDLLALNPFRGIDIVTPSEFVKRYS